MVLQKVTFDSRFQSPQDLRCSEWFPPMGLGMGAYPSKWLILPCYCLWASEGIWFHDDWGADLRVDGWCNCMDFLKHVREGYFKPSFAQNQRHVSGLLFFFFNRARRRLTCSANEQFPLRDVGRTMTHHDVSHFCEHAPITYQYCMSYANMHYAARHITHKKPCFRSLACWRVCRTSLWMNEWPWKRKKQRNDTPMLLGAFLVLRRDVRWKRRLDQ